MSGAAKGAVDVGFRVGDLGFQKRVRPCRTPGILQEKTADGGIIVTKPKIFVLLKALACCLGLGLQMPFFAGAALEISQMIVESSL